VKRAGLKETNIENAPDIVYALVRSKRKTLAIYITKDATVEVRAPLDMPLRHIERFVRSKRKWIAGRLAKRSDAADAKAAFTLGYGERVLFRGRLCPITAVGTGSTARTSAVSDASPALNASPTAGTGTVSNVSHTPKMDSASAVGFIDGRFVIPAGLSGDMIKETLIRIYKHEAKRILGEKLRYYAALARVRYTGFRVTSAKTRWGSCSSGKSVNFSWRLIMADDDVIDYVVAHEVAHLREMNHSARFWALVAQAIPDYADKKKKLRQLQDTLSCQNWD